MGIFERLYGSHPYQQPHNIRSEQLQYRVGPTYPDNASLVLNWKAGPQSSHPRSASPHRDYAAGGGPDRVTPKITHMSTVESYAGTKLPSIRTSGEALTGKPRNNDSITPDGGVGYHGCHDNRQGKLPFEGYYRNIHAGRSAGDSLVTKVNGLTGPVEAHRPMLGNPQRDRITHSDINSVPIGMAGDKPVSPRGRRCFSPERPGERLGYADHISTAATGLTVNEPNPGRISPFAKAPYRAHAGMMSNSVVWNAGGGVGGNGGEDNISSRVHVKERVVSARRVERFAGKITESTLGQFSSGITRPDGVPPPHNRHAGKMTATDIYPREVGMSGERMSMVLGHKFPHYMPHAGRASESVMLHRPNGVAPDGSSPHHASNARQPRQNSAGSTWATTHDSMYLSPGNSPIGGSPTRRGPPAAWAHTSSSFTNTAAATAAVAAPIAMSAA